MASIISQPHFVLIPLMAQGHMIPMIDMAGLFAKRGVIVSLVTTPYNASRFDTTIHRATESGQFSCQEVGLPKGQQELGFSTRFYKEISFLMASLLSLLQVKSQNSGNPFETHGAIVLLFILSMIVYVVISAWISKLAPNTSYLPILKHVQFIFVTFACGLLLVILVPAFGWIMVVICASMFIKLLCGSHEQILDCITQAFNVLCDLFQDNFQSLCQAFSRAFIRSLMPTLPTANSTERQGVEMAEIVVE